MQRLFSNFADGWPGAGLLLLRMLSGGGLLYSGITSAWSATHLAMVQSVIAAASGLLLVVGLYTPVAGTMAAFVEAWIAFSHPGNLSAPIELMGLGLSLAMIGPGAWSIDARLFGRKQINTSEFGSGSDSARKW